MVWTRNDGADERLREMQLREIQDRFGVLHQRQDRARRRQVRRQELRRRFPPFAIIALGFLAPIVLVAVAWLLGI